MQTSKSKRAGAWAALMLVILASTYLAVLCALNTSFGAGARAMALIDGGIVIMALALALYGQAQRLLLPILILAANVLLLSAINGGFNAKAARDVLAPLAFLALAWRYGGIRSAKTVFYTVSAIVVVFGLYEYFAAEDYTKHFNILRFYIDRGLVSEQQAQWVDGSYFVSATRGAERMLFPVLGQHRVSSIFLEPVSMGNFGAIAAAWALSLDVRQRRMAWVAAFVAVFALVAADARFGLFCVIAFLIARFAILRQWTNAAVIVLPIVTLVLLFIMGALNIGQGDDLPTRLAGSGRALAAMSPAELFGFQSDRLSTQDSGYYYIFKTFGLLFFVLTWLGFAATPSPGPQSQRFKLYLAIYMALLLCVSSTSLFALKTAALAFFLYGSLAVSEGLAQTARAHGAALRTALAP